MSFPWFPRHNGKTRRASPAVLRRRRGLHFMVALALVGGRAWAAGPGPTEIPIPKLLNDPVHPFVQAGAAKWNSNTATLTQTSANVQLNWASFNIGSNATVVFNQPNVNSTAVNHIWDSNPSQIFGHLTANGQVYLLNQNGIIFGPTAQINVGTLVASALDITPAALSTDIGSAINSGSAAFTAFTDSSGNPIVNGSITVLPGANLQGKQIFLFAPNVTNAGHIETTDGQAILAAGTEIYLIESSNSFATSGADFQSGDFNGYVVEVKVDNVSNADLQNYLKSQLTTQPGGAVTLNQNATLSSGTVANSALGEIIANRGNVSLIGLAVNQKGRVSATTSVRSNGSIRLVAKDELITQPPSGGLLINTPRTGAVYLGPNSVTEVRPDLTDPTTDVALDLQPRSNVRLDGQTVFLDQGAQVTATSGNVFLTAHDAQVTTPGGTPSVFADDSWVYLASSSGIDVSGNNVTLPMASNVLSVQLRGPELQNSQLQTSLLYGQTISVDLRQHGTRADGTPWYGTPLVDLSGDVAVIGSTVVQRSTTGGTVTIDTNGSAIIRAGADINLSGGVAHYNAGYVNTTQLFSQGTVYDIANTSPNVVYSGIAGTFTVKHAKWGVTQSWNIPGAGNGHFENAYNVGMDAGSLTLKGPQLIVDGNIHADTVIGPYQRNSPSVLTPGQQRWQDEVPLGGQIILGDASPVSSTQPDYRAPDVQFSADQLLSSLSFNPATNTLTDVLPGYTAVYLSPDLPQNGLSRMVVYSNGSIDLPAGVPLNLPAGGILSLTSGGGIDLEGQIHVPAGSVSLSVKPPATTSSPKALIIGNAASIDVSGSWVNDSLATSASPAPVLINGGTVSLKNTYGDLDLKSGSVIDVSGGAWLQANGKIKNGNGGSITLAVQPLVHPDNSVTPATLDLGGTLRSYASGTGGTLNIAANGICIGLSCVDGVPGQLNLDPELFSQGGFANYKLTSNLDNLEILGDATIIPRIRSLILDPSAAAQPTGSNLAGFSQATVLPDAQRTPVNLEFDAAPNISGFSSFNQLGVLMMDAGARILADAGARVSFNSSTRMYVDGTVDAPAGNLSFGLTTGLPQIGYIPSQSLWFGPQAQLIATGAVQWQPNALGLREGEVLPGGTISIGAQRGYIVAQSGATIDVSGTAAPIDLSRPGGAVQTTTIASDAGAVNLTAAEGIFFDGTLRGQAGGPGAAGGSFTLTLDPQLISGFTGTNIPPSAAFPINPRVITLNDGTGPSVPSWLSPGSDFVNPATGQTLSGQAPVNGAALIQGGFDAVTLVSRNLDPTLRSPSVASETPGEIQLQGGTGTLALALGRSLTLDAASLTLAPNTTQATVSAPYMLLGNSGSTAQLQQTPLLTPLAGSGTLEFDGQLIDVLGNSVTQNIGKVTMDSQGDIRLRGLQQDQGRALTGSFTTAGDMHLIAAQVYPTTLSSFTLQSTGTQGTIQFLSQGQATPVLEAGGRMNVVAANIDQGGVIKAPLGEIDLNALQNLQLDAGSLTSTSADGQLIPFGQLQGGFAWAYQLNGQTLAFGETDALPQKRISLSAPTISVAGPTSVAPGATINVSGGGDFFAYQFNPGVLSSKDLLLTANTPNTFAILPGLNPLYAPYDPQEYTGSALRPGDSVYLAGGIPGLNPGQYALLPARYALLPGAYLVTAVSGYQDLAPGQRASLTDGVPVVSGYRTVAGTDIRDARNSGFAVQPGSSILTQASYDTQVASNFFTNLAATNGTAVPRLPQDAGVVAINAQQTLELKGNLLAATTGRGAAVDISAAQIEVIPQAGAGQAIPGVLQLGADQLNAFGAESLLLGATRTDTSAGTELNVGATQVTVDTGANLHAPELMLAARDTINVNSGSQLTATGTLSGTPSNILIGDSANGVKGNGALLRLAAGPQAGVVRQNYDQTSGTLYIQDGATLKADGSMILDATNNLSFASSANLIDHGALTVGAGSVSLGDVPAGTGGFVLSSAAIANLGETDLALRSYSSLNLYGNVALKLHSLSLETGEIASGSGVNNTQATLSTSGDLSWSNPNSPYSSAPTGQGSLMLHGARVLLGDGTYVARGFSNVTIEADNEIVTQGIKGNLGVAGNLTLSAPRVTGAAKSDMTITAGDGSGKYFPVTIDLGRNSPSAPLPAPDLGARLALTGASITQGGNIDLPSGSLTIAAKGPAMTDSVVLASGSQTLVGGSTKSFGGTNVYAPGGDVTLTSDSGNVNVQANAQINVAGGPDGGNGGTLTMSTPTGTVQLDGQINGTALAGYAGASVSLDTTQFFITQPDGSERSDFSSLNSILGSTGFTGSFTLRERRGNIVIGTGDNVKVQNVELSADSGGIDVFGTVDASGAKGGSVTLNAQNDISLQGATIKANATGAGQDGGRVALNTRTGGILMDSSSTINVSGGSTDPTTGVTGAGGQVALRLPQTSVLSVLGNVGPSKLSLAGSITGSAQTTIEGFKIYDYSGNTVHAGQIVTADTTADPGNPLYSDASAFMNQASTVLTALGPAGGNVNVVPGIEIGSSGDLTLASTWDFNQTNVVVDSNNISHTYTWKFSSVGEAGVLTLRAAGNLNINNTITDNFNSNNVLQSGPSSWTYRLVAGADLNGVSPLALGPDGQGNFTLASGIPSKTQTAIRTGAADIAIAAAGNIVLGNSASVVYTAGNASTSSSETDAATGITTTTTPVKLRFLNNLPYPQGKSDITIDALGNIGYSDGAIIPNQLFTGWLYRAGNSSSGASSSRTGWTVAFDHFQQGIGALAGGNVTVQAGGDINDLSVSIPTIGIPENVTVGSATATNQLAILGGGDLHVAAGGNIASGIFYTGQGDMTVRAGDSLTSDHMAASANLQPEPVYTILGLGNGQANIVARGDLMLETIVNPTLVLQDNNAQRNSINNPSVFSTYSPNSAAHLTAIGGDITLDNNKNTLENYMPQLPYASTNAQALLTAYPPLLQASALSGNIDVQGSMTLFPAPKGNLELLANGSVTLEPWAQVVLSDADPNLLPSPSNPVTTYTYISTALQSIYTPTPASNITSLEHASVPVHADQNQPDGQPDTTPAQVIALTGDVIVVADPTASTPSTFFDLAKPVEISAGRDVRDLLLVTQNLHAGDETRVAAGRDIMYTNLRDSSGSVVANNGEIVVDGPGRLTLEAGRNVDLAASNGISSRGNTYNAALPSGGADITVLTGAAGPVDYASFIQRYFVTGQNYSDELTAYMQTLTGDSPLTNAAALAAFQNLPLSQQQPMVLRAFYEELRATGESAAGKASVSQGYSRGFAAISTLFPSAPANYAGDLTLYFSKIYTLSGGDINLVVPGGKINAGLSTAPVAFGANLENHDLGIEAQSLGSVNAFSYGDFLVNASRVFAADGGNIMLWSSTGNIDAGRGAKTALSAPPPTVIFAHGQAIITFPPALKGSGIREFVTTPRRAPGVVDLFAPAGVVNAGDAGIGSAGNLYIAAQQVIGAGNIQVSGQTTGVPEANVGGLSASISGVGSVAATAGQVGNDVTQNLGDQLNNGFLGVEVMGFGDE